MNKFKFYFIVITASVLFFSCSKDDDNDFTIEPPRDYATQYKADTLVIVDYLKNNYFEVVNKPGTTEDQDIVINKLVAGKASIMSYLNAPTYPKLLFKEVELHSIKYKLYYLVLRPGIGISPCSVDGVLTSYKGTYLSQTTTTPSEVTATLFEEVKFPQSTLSLYGVITGWSETFPLFKTGTSKINTDGTVSYFDFGSGVMFLPSGLAYYNIGSGAIPAYSPLVFSFKLYNVQRLDQDNDGVFSFQEDSNNDGFVRFLASGTANPDDTDKDGIPDFLDVDDDGDNYTTRLEITKPEGTNSGLSKYFPYDPIADDPLTTAIETETKGIPSYDKVAKTFDYTTPNRIRIHIDNTYPVKP